MKNFFHQFIDRRLSWYVSCSESCYLFPFKAETLCDPYWRNESLGLREKYWVLTNSLWDIFIQTLNCCFFHLRLGVCIDFERNMVAWTSFFKLDVIIICIVCFSCFFVFICLFDVCRLDCSFSFFLCLQRVLTTHPRSQRVENNQK